MGSNSLRVSCLVFALSMCFFGCAKNYAIDTTPTGQNVGQGGDPGPSPSPSPSPSPIPTPCVPTPSNTPIITTLPSNINSATIAAICPAIGHDSECGIVIIISNSGVNLYYTQQPPYDGNDDTLVGVINTSSSPVSSLDLSSTLDIMGFDNDGIDTYLLAGTNSKVPGNSTDDSGYGGPNAYYTNIANNKNSGTVNFIAPVSASGGTTYFSLENSLSSTSACLTTSPH